MSFWSKQSMALHNPCRMALITAVAAVLTTVMNQSAIGAAIEDVATNARQATVWIRYERTDSATGAIEERTGSGFIVSKDGLVVTAYHVVEPWLEQIVSEQVKHPLSARISSINSPNAIGLAVVNYDKVTDLAVLRLRDPRSYPFLLLCFVSDLRPGTPFIAFGFPLGKEFTPFSGLISNTDAPGARWSANVDFEEGASGGPVLDMDGRVIGLVKGGYGDATAIRYVTQIIRARSLLQNVGVQDDCTSSPPKPTSASPVIRAALRVSAEPDTIQMAPGGYTAVNYRFVESKGLSVQVETEDTLFSLPSGEPIGKENVGGRILGGSFQVDGGSVGIYSNNIYLPPDVASVAKLRGGVVQLRHLFHCRDANGNSIQVPAVLRIRVL